MTALSTIHIGLKQLGIVEEDARDLYERMAGKRSLRAMTPAQHKAVIDELRRLGFKPTSKGSRKRIEGKYAAKLQALWIAGYNLGLIRNKDDGALLAFVKRQTGIDHTRFLRYAEDGARAIEALKGWLERDGGVDWSKDRSLPDWTQVNGYRIARAQFRKLVALGFVERPDTEDWLLEGWLIKNGYANAALMTDRSWIDAMNKMGAMIRAGTPLSKREVA